MHSSVKVALVLLVVACLVDQCYTGEVAAGRFGVYQQTHDAGLKGAAVSSGHPAMERADGYGAGHGTGDASPI